MSDQSAARANPRPDRTDLRQLLIVSPHFPPINAPDHQRIRMSLPYFREFGWEPTVLCVKPDQVEAARDPMLAETVPETTRVVRSGSVPRSITRPLGFGSLGLRALPNLHAAGVRLLKRNRFDLVYISTTIFTAMALGRRWFDRFQVPYVLDFQDPWLSDFYYRPGSPPPPGGWFKYRFSQTIARLLEPYAVRRAAHVISVSPEYPKVLRARYEELTENRCTVMPFGAPAADFEIARSGRVTQSVFDPEDGLRHWVYVGRGGGDMVDALRVLFGAIEKERESAPEKWSEVRLHFVGTSYAPKDRAVKTIEPVAKDFGLGDLVSEQTDRVPYLESLRILLESDVIVLIGSNDYAYTASKLYPCVLAERPILAVMHEKSSVNGILRQINAGEAAPFRTGQDPSVSIPHAREILKRLVDLPREEKPKTDWEAFRPYTAREMTRRQCEIFDRCCHD